MSDTGTEYRAEYEGSNDAPAASPAVEARIRAILLGHEFPALSRDIIETLQSMPDDDASLQRLANLVLREYSLTLKVVRTANSALHRRSGHAIQSATHAMILLGARNVRQIAGSLLLFEHYQRKSPGLKELMLLSLLTANHAREIAIRSGGFDPEEAHLCGMFRNLGEVLVAAHFPTDYAHILELIAEWRKSESEAARSVLSFRYEDLGVAMARHWGMPDSVLRGMRAEGAVSSSVPAGIVAMSQELTNAIYRHDATRESDIISTIAGRYRRRLNLSDEQLREVIATALTETREVIAGAGVRLDDLRLRQLCQTALSALGAVGAEEIPAECPEPDRGADDLPHLREQLMREVRVVADPASGDDVLRVLLVTLEAIYRGGPFDRAILCVLSADRSELRGRYGFGADVDGMLERFRFDMSPREGLIVLATKKRQSIYVPVERDFSAQETRWAQSLGVSSFGVFPVVVGGRTLGCVYCDRAHDAPIPGRDALAFVRRLCADAERTIAERGSRRPSPAASRPASA
jgi:HD-like signal output (HDOD) protein